MRQELALVAVLVPDYDEAIAYFTRVLGFTLTEDTALSDSKRWVVVSPPGASGSRLLLARAKSPDERSRIGMQAGARVFLFLHTDDFARDHATYRLRGVRFLEEPRYEPYGIVAQFEDRYGNRWDLIQPR